MVGGGSVTPRLPRGVTPVRGITRTGELAACASALPARLTPTLNLSSPRLRAEVGLPLDIAGKKKHALTSFSLGYPVRLPVVMTPSACWWNVLDLSMYYD